MMGDLVVRLGLNSKGFTRGLDQSQSKLGTFSKKVVGGMFKIGAVLGTVVASAVSAAVYKFAQYGDQLDKMAARTGFTTNALSELGFAAEQSGTDIDSLEKGIKGMQMQLLNAERGLSTATDSLDDLGLSYSDLAGLSPEDQFMKIAGAVADIDDPSRKAALALSIFGRAGQKLIPLLNAGTDGLEALRQEARDLGISMSPEDAKIAAEFTDALNSAKKAAMGLIYQVGAPVAKVMTRVFRLGISLVSDLKDSFGSLGPSIGTVEEAFLKVTLGFVSTFNEAIHFFVAVMPAVLSGFADNWKAVFKTAYDYVQTIFLNIGKNIKTIMGSIWDHIASGGKSKLELAWTPLTEGFESSLKQIVIPERLKTKLEQELESQLAGLGQEKKKNKEKGSGGSELGVMKEKKTAGAALKGSTEAISSILRNASGGDTIQKKMLKEAEKQNKKLDEQKKATNKVTQAIKTKPAVAVTGASIP